ncbi:importin-11-like [Rhopilema esculentum]|uniref:importin-11-like n=1 Tax=Rhopilema esculentum TaxID=499914 RepID=UPI0031CEAFDC
MAALDMLLKILDQAVSQDPQVVKFAEGKLKEWEDKPEFYKTLLDICFNQALPSHIRWIGILSFKNGIEKYWRRAINRIFTEEDKNYLKSLLISSFTEQVNQISLQIAVVIGRIARTDLKTWPDLVPKLLQEVRSQDSIVQYNALLTLNHVIKGLVSKRLASDRKTFKEVCSGLLGFVLELWIHHSNNFISHLSSNQVQSAEQSLKMSVLTLKVLRKLVVEGTCDDVLDSSLMLLKLLVERIPALLTLRSQFLSVNIIGEKLEKLILIGMKTLLDTLDRQPLPFVDVLEGSLNMAIKFSFVCTEKDILFEMFIVHCINLIRKAIKCKDYKLQKDSHSAECTNVKIQKAQEIKQNIFTKDLLVELCHQLVFKYFPLTSQEVNEWQNDPESYLTDEAGDSAEYLIRPCTENLFLCLYYEHRPIFTDVLADMVNQLSASYNREDLESLRMREAVYFALGLASYELFGDFNFDKYFQETLIIELEDSSASMKIIHRRILWLIGRWIDVSFSKESRIILYRVLVKMLDRKEDLVVRVTASKTLKDAIDDYQFENKDILPYLKDLWERLFCLLIDVQECDTKMGVLNVISILIERAGREMKPYATALCQYLPHLWADSAEHNMLRCVVVSTLRHIVEALGSESVVLHPLLLSVIHLSTDHTQPSHVYLIDDGLELWFAVMQNSPVMTEDFLAAFAVLPAILEQTSENFKTCVSIIESYILLDALNVLKIHSSSLVGIIDTLLGQMKDEGNILLSELIQKLLILLPNETSILFETVLSKILKIILEDKEYPRVMTSYLTIFGYVLLHNSTIFFNMLQKYCFDVNEKPERAAARFIDVWLEKVDFMSNDKSRQITAMALISLLPLNAEFVNERFALILDAVVNVLHGVSAENSDEQSSALMNPSDSCNDQNFEKEQNCGDQRKKQMMAKDIISSVSLLDFVKLKITETRNTLGDEQFQFHMDTLDSMVSKQLISLLG